MSERVFLDTNVLVYAYDEDEPERRERALEILEGSGTTVRPVVSTQVLQEFYAVATRKLRRTLQGAELREALERIARFPVASVDRQTVLRAVDLAERHRLSIWDALILRSAKESGCRRVLTEDLQDGFEVAGVRVDDPFRGTGEPAH